MAALPARANPAAPGETRSQQGQTPPPPASRAPRRGKTSPHRAKRAPGRCKSLASQPSSSTLGTGTPSPSARFPSSNPLFAAGFSWECPRLCVFRKKRQAPCWGRCLFWERGHPARARPEGTEGFPGTSPPSPRYRRSSRETLRDNSPVPRAAKMAALPGGANPAAPS